MNIKKFIKQNQEMIIVGFVSLIAFILGWMAIGPVWALLIIGGIDLFFIIPKLWKGKRKTMKKSPKKEITHQKKAPSKRKKIIYRALFLMFCLLCVAGILGIIAFYLYIAKSAPEFKPEELYKKESSVLIDINGNEYATLGDENRTLVTYDELPEVLINAIVATEDSRFFQHSGVDWARFLKASLGQLLGNSDAGGASTLTMQIAKNAFTDAKQRSGFAGIKRKFTDVYIALNKIEKKYSKEQIMEFYVNSYYLGSGAYGVQQASKTYFGKDVKNVNLAEASLIAGLFQAPNSYDPNKNIEAAKDRQKIVLKLMLKHGYITEKEMNAALAIDLKDLVIDDDSGEGGTNDKDFQPFIDTVISDVKNKTGKSPYDVSMRIYTTMDPEKQKHMTNIMTGGGYKWPNDVVTAGIAAINVEDGSLAAVGTGRKSGKRNFNNATQLSNQIGSTSKPLYDYGPAIEYENWSPAYSIVDEPISYSDGTKINNWDSKYNGLMTARTALAQSRNITALKAFQANKNANIKEFVTNLGLHPETGSNGVLHEAHSIGGYTGESPLSMAVAYAAFANGGYYVEPYTYTKIVYTDNDADDSNDKVLEFKPEKKRAMSEETAYIVYDMLKSSATWGLGSEAKINGAEFGAKTGTSNYDGATMKAKGLPSNAINDYWVCGVSKDYSIAVWYGYDQKDVTSKYVNKMGQKYHRTLFQAVAKGFFKKGSKVSKPSGVVEATIEKETYPALLPSELTPDNMKVTDLFKKGTEPDEVSPRFTKLKDVSGATSTLSGDQITIKWNPIATPDNINKSKITAFLSGLYKNEGYLNNAVNKQLSYFGNVTYQIYDGSKLITSTENNSVTFPASASSSGKYTIKTTYSNYKGLTSNGVNVTVDLSGIPINPPIDQDNPDDSNSDNT